MTGTQAAAGWTAASQTAEIMSASDVAAPTRSNKAEGRAENCSAACRGAALENCGKTRESKTSPAKK